MPRILILSSFVTLGHVGLSAGQPFCLMMGVNVTAVPSTVLSNHPGWPEFAQVPVPAERIAAMTDALSANGLLADHDAVLVGYMPSVAHVEVAASLVNRVLAMAPDAHIVVGPILGDQPKGLYVPQDVASAVRDSLFSKALSITPNLFELEWLSGRDCASFADIEIASRALGVARGGGGQQVFHFAHLNCSFRIVGARHSAIPCDLRCRFCRTEKADMITGMATVRMTL